MTFRHSQYQHEEGILPQSVPQSVEKALAFSQLHRILIPRQENLEKSTMSQVYVFPIIMRLNIDLTHG